MQSYMINGDFTLKINIQLNPRKILIAADVAARIVRVFDMPRTLSDTSCIPADTRSINSLREIGVIRRERKFVCALNLHRALSKSNSPKSINTETVEPLISRLAFSISETSLLILTILSCASSAYSLIRVDISVSPYSERPPIAVNSLLLETPNINLFSPVSIVLYMKII